MDDAEDEWIFSKTFNFVHGRMLFPCFKDPKKVIKMAFNSMDPDGYMELQDAVLPFQSDDESLDNTDLKQWMEELMDSAKNQDRDWTCASKYKKYMEDVGFVDVQEVRFKWPINPWPVGKKDKELGLWCMANLLDGLEAFSMYLFTESGKSMEEVQTLLVNVRNDLKNRSIHAYIPM